MNTAARLLSTILQPGRLTSVVDIGANPIDGSPPYQSLLDNKLCNVTGFEPQEVASGELANSEFETYLPYAVGDGNKSTLHLCKAPGMTSLLEPDTARLSQFNLFEEFGSVTNTVPIHTKRLDDIEEIEFLDYLKIDIQGSELSVFQNGTEKLKKCAIIQTEVSFIQLYKDQPSFGEVDTELRTQGFVPHAFAAIKQWPIAPIILNNEPRQHLNQLLEADMVYVRDFTRPESIPDEQLKHLALVSHWAYQSVDLTFKCLTILSDRGLVAKEDLQKYLAALGGD